MIQSLRKALIILYLAMPLALSAQNDASVSNITAAMATRGQDACIKCHENQAERRLNQPVLDWMMSVHAVRGQSCNGCHGGNPEIFDEEKSKSKEYGFIGKPGKEQITDFCGRGGCHARELSEFKQGPHYQTVLETGLPSCVTCHGDHDVKQSSSDIIDNKNCSVCHGQERAREMLKTMKMIEFSIDAIQENIEYLDSKHANVDNLSSRLNRTRSLFHSYVHIFSREKVRSTQQIIQLEIQNLRSESLTLRRLAQRLDILYWAMLTLGIAISLYLMVYTILTLTRRRRYRKDL